jgi:hypothetical protein
MADTTTPTEVKGVVYYITTIITTIVAYFTFLFQAFGGIFYSVFRAVYLSFRGVYDALAEIIKKISTLLKEIYNKLFLSKLYEALIQPFVILVRKIYDNSFKIIFDRIWRDLQQNPIYKYVIGFFAYLLGIIYLLSPATPPPRADATPAAAAPFNIFEEILRGIYNIFRAIYLLILGVFYTILQADDTTTIKEPFETPFFVERLPFFKIITAVILYFMSNRIALSGVLFWMGAFLIIFSALRKADPTNKIFNDMKDKKKKGAFWFMFLIMLFLPAIGFAAYYSIPQIGAAISQVFKYIVSGAGAGGGGGGFADFVETVSKAGGATAAASGFFKTAIEWLNTAARHFAAFRGMDIMSSFYILFSSIFFICLMFYMYYKQSQQSYYLFLLVALALFIAPTVQHIWRNGAQIQNSAAKLILVFGSVISLLLMHITHSFMESSERFNILKEQQGDRTIFDIIFVFFSAILVFYVNFTLLRPNFSNPDMLNFIMLIHFVFIMGMLIYAIAFKIKLRNRLDTSPDEMMDVATKDSAAAVKTETGTLVNARFPITE